MVGWPSGTIWARGCGRTTHGEQVGTLAAVGENRPMRDLKRMVTYDTIIPVLENYPELLAGCRGTLETLAAVLGKEFEKSPGAEADENWGMIHGDFWSGK